jgi:hypothetical protein
MKNLLLSISLLFLAACASSVNVDYKKTVNFAQLRTFVVQSKPVNVSEDTRVDSPFMQQRTVKAIGDNLVARGMQVNKENPDVIVKYHLLVRQEIESDDSGVTLGFGTATRHSFWGLAYDFPYQEVSSVDNLVVTIDMVDSKGELLWRGSYGRRLYDGSTPETSTRLMYEIVNEILKTYPPQ